MKDIIYNYIIQAVLGAASGYITNDYAINMLFKEYTPLKIGGIIKKTRDDFTYNLSSLVENDLINKEKINKIIADDDFKDKLENIIKDFVIEDSLVSNIDGIDSTIKATGEFLDLILENHLQEVIVFIKENINLDDLLSDEQKIQMSNSLVNTLFQTIDETAIINKMLNLLYSEKGNIKLKSIINIPEEKILNITSNTLHNILLNYLSNEELVSALNEIADCLIFNDNLIEKLYQKPIKDIFKIDDSLKNNTVKLFIKHINSNEFQNIVYSISKSVFTYLKNIDKTLFDITNSSLEINLKSYFIYSLPNLTDYLIEWVDFNSVNINNIIEDSINEVIKESDKMKALLLTTIKNAYLNNKIEKFNIVEKIQSFIENETDPYKLGEQFSNEIIKYLKNTSISELIASLENKDILNSKKLTNYIIQYLNNNANSIIDNLFDYIAEQRVEKLLTNNLISKDNIRKQSIKHLKNQFLSYGKNALNKQANIYLTNLMDKNIVDIIPANADNFIVQYLNRNKSNLENLIVNNFSITSININDENLSNLISHEIKEKYFGTSNNYKNKNLSIILDKINQIKNFHNKSSEILRAFIIRNMDYWIGGSVKAIVYENLNKLSDDELVDFANDFIGRELQPIMYFGGILGALFGLALAFIQNAPLDIGLVTWENMITYSLVGYLTNVIAINMIFKPYREIKWLSKIPFLRNFSLGYIVKNQKIFAKTTSHFVDETLLSKENINVLFIKNEDKIKTSIYNNIENNNFSIFQNILKNNHMKIISSSCKYVTEKFKKNNKKISNFIFSKLKNIKFAVLLNNYKTKIIDFFKDKIVESRENISDFIISKFKSEKSLESQLPVTLINASKTHTKNYIEKYYENIHNSIDLSSLREKLTIYEKDYVDYINRPIKDIVSPAYIDGAGSKLAQNINEHIFSHDVIEKIFIFLNDLLLKPTGESHSVGEVFKGKIRIFVSNNLTIFFNQLTNIIKNTIIDNKVAVSLKIQSEVKNSLGLLEKGMYSMLGGGEIIDDVISKIMLIKTPQFIDSKSNELLTIFSGTMAESFYKIKMKDIYENINIVNTKEIVNDYLSNSNNRNIIENNISKIIDLLKNNIKDANLKYLLNTLHIGDMNSIFDNYKDELNSILSVFSLNMTENKEKIIDRISNIFNEILDTFIKNTSFNDLFNCISTEDIKNTADNLIEILGENNFIDLFLSEALKIYTENIENKEIYLSQIIDENEFVISCEQSIENLLLNSNAEEFIKQILSDILGDAINNNLNFIDYDTKSYFTDLFIEGSIKSIKENLNYILKSIEFDKIAQEEIEAMDARKIHDLFNSFCGKYFKRLMLYGLGGFIFGINIYIGLSLTALKIIGENFLKKD